MRAQCRAHDVLVEASRALADMGYIQSAYECEQLAVQIYVGTWTPAVLMELAELKVRGGHKGRLVLQLYRPEEQRAQLVMRGVLVWLARNLEPA